MVLVVVKLKGLIWHYARLSINSSVSNNLKLEQPIGVMEFLQNFCTC